MAETQQICEHPRWSIDNHNIGTCINPECGEQRQFPFEKGEDVKILRPSKCNTTPVKTENKRNRRGRNYTHLPGVRKHQYFEKNKDAMIADLFSLGRATVRSKWGISKSGLSGLEKRWLTTEQKDQITDLGVERIQQSCNGRLPVFPKFSDTWQPLVQLKWFEIYEKLLDRNFKLNIEVQ